jgi:hypothetical protein
MTTNKKDTLAKTTVAQKASEKPLSKPNQAALDAANAISVNDGSHIEAERKKLLAEAIKNKDNN